MARPELFRYIEHHVPVGKGYTHYGLVTRYFSSQFGYTKADGTLGISTLTEDWRLMTNTTNEQKPMSVEAPSVWRDHESRTCIVLAVDEYEGVSYIPLQVNTPFAVKTADKESFLKKLYLKPIDYPVSKAARLYVEYARSTGATDEMLEALSKFTHITEEEKMMAKTKASSIADAEVAAASKKQKTTAKKQAAPTAKSASPKQATPQKPTKKPATKKPSAASVYRDMIREGKTAQLIVAAVSKQFPDKPGRMDYVKYYWRELVRKGEDIPEPKGLE